MIRKNLRCTNDHTCMSRNLAWLSRRVSGLGSWTRCRLSELASCRLFAAFRVHALALRRAQISQVCAAVSRPEQHYARSAGVCASWRRMDYLRATPSANHAIVVGRCSG
jgi:hypothetical protein